MAAALPHWPSQLGFQVHSEAPPCIWMLQRGLEFCKLTGFPPEHLLGDPENVTYDALEFKKGVLQTFFSPEVRHFGRENGSATALVDARLGQRCVHSHRYLLRKILGTVA